MIGPVRSAPSLSYGSPRVRYFENASWPKLAAELVQDAITGILLNQGECSVMLTGGRGAQRLYAAWADLPAFRLIRGVRFYFGDERCVPSDDLDSNYGMAMRTLFYFGVPTGCAVFRMEADDIDRDAAARRYDDILPAAVDVLLLGVGEDGHVASLFPGSQALQEVSRRVVPVVGVKLPHERLTITPAVILQAKLVIVLASGAQKNSVLANAIESNGDINVLPACLALNGTWLLDTEFS